MLLISSTIDGVRFLEFWKLSVVGYQFGLR